MRLFRRFLREADGVSAVEFAIIAPFLVMLYFGTVQLTLALTADRKLSQTATTIGDLVTQDEYVTDAELTTILAAADAVMAPYPADTLNLRISSVRMDLDGDIYIDWSEATGTYSPHPEGMEPTEIPDGLMAEEESIIWVEAKYDYVTPFGEDVWFGKFELRDNVYLRPRRSLFVQRED
jgi:Flp pilus assembly pilin Flp